MSVYGGHWTLCSWFSIIQNQEQADNAAVQRGMDDRENDNDLKSLSASQAVYIQAIFAVVPKNIGYDSVRQPGHQAFPFSGRRYLILCFPSLSSIFITTEFVFIY